MRPASMLPVALAAIVLAGCAAEIPSNRETTASVTDEAASLDRDLTLQASATPAVEVASPVELSRAAPEARTRPAVPRKLAKPAPAPAPVVPPPALEPVPLAGVALADVAVEDAPVEDATAGAGRELAPGKTVTAIPVSSGPSYAPEADDSWLPSGPARGIVVGGGDTCRRRGGARGIGIAGRIPGGVPRHRLR